MKKYIAAMFVGLGSLGFLFSHAEAQVLKSSQMLQLAQATINIDEAKTIALEQVNGKVINIGLEHEDNTLVYDVDIQKSGHIYEVSVDAEVGKVLDVKKELKEMNH